MRSLLHDELKDKNITVEDYTKRNNSLILELKNTSFEFDKRRDDSNSKSKNADVLEHKISYLGLQITPLTDKTIY